MATVRKLGRTTSQRKAMLRSLATQLLLHGKIKTTETRAKEVRTIVEPLISLACKEADNFETVTVKAKVARKDKDGKRVKENNVALSIIGVSSWYNILFFSIKYKKQLAAILLLPSEKE